MNSCPVWCQNLIESFCIVVEFPFFKVKNKKICKTILKIQLRVCILDFENFVNLVEYEQQDGPHDCEYPVLNRHVLEVVLVLVVDGSREDGKEIEKMYDQSKNINRKTKNSFFISFSFLINKNYFLQEYDRFRPLAIFKRNVRPDRFLNRHKINRYENFK